MLECIGYKALVKPSGKIPSVNCAYKPGQNGRRAWLYLDPEVGQFKTEITELVQMSDLMKLKAYKDGINHLKLNMVMYISRDGFWKRDTSNMVKITEDAIAEAVGIDDRFTLMVSSIKVPSPNGQEAVGIGLKAYLRPDYEHPNS